MRSRPWSSRRCATPRVIKEDVLDTIEEMIARIDQKLTAQMNEILHAPEFQQIESAWRGLHYLVFNSETDSTLKIRVMNVSKNELYRNLRLYPDAKWDQSPLFKQLYEVEFGQLGGEPYGCADRRLLLQPPADRRAADARSQQDRGRGACAVLRRRRPDAAGNGQVDRAVEPARHRQDLRHAGICGLEGPARSRTIRATSACACRACWHGYPYRGEVGAGRGVRLRGGHRRPHRRQVRLDECRLCDGRQHQPGVQGVRLVHAHSRRAVGRRGH